MLKGDIRSSQISPFGHIFLFLKIISLFLNPLKHKNKIKNFKI